MNTETDHRILAQVRSVKAGGSSVPTATHVGYLIYLAILVTAIVAVPLVRSILLGVATPEVLATITGPGSYRLVGAVGAVLAAGTLLIARTRGPIVPSPFLTEFLVGSHLARSDTLRRPFLISTGVLALTAVMVSGIVIGARFLGGPIAVRAAVFVLVACVAYSGVLAVLWLIGQSCPRRTTIPLAVVIVGTACAIGQGIDAVLLLTPWGWLALVWEGLGQSVSPIPWWPVIALALSPLFFLAVPALLNNLRGGEVMVQARRWQSIGTFVQTGDVAAASGVLRSPPTRGRHSRIRLTGPIPLAILQRDSAAAGRFPVRSALGAVALLGAGWLNAHTSSVGSGLEWIVALSSVLLAYLAAGVWCDGLRNANENAGPASLYGRSAVTMIGSHSLLPALACTVLGSTGAGVAVAGGPGTSALVWWILISVFIVLVRILDCAKGPMPIGLLLPIVTPAGDVSILNVIARQFDALIIVLTIAGGLSVFVVTAGPESTICLISSIAIVTALAARRIRVLGSSSIS